jgi:Fur family transcriptional regulator, stress-responsive regulator
VAAAKTSEGGDFRDLRVAGSRVTGPRLAVLAALREGAHLTVEQITVLSRRRLGAVPTQAGDDVLRVLAGAGLIGRIEPADSATRVGDNHHHLICRACGSGVDVDCVVGHAPCLEPPSGFGYEIKEAEITYWGLCAGCCPAVDGCVQIIQPPREEVVAYD